MNVRMRFYGEIERLENGSIRFPQGGSVEYNGVERRVKIGDEIKARPNKDGSVTLLINGIPAEDIPLDA